MIFFDKTQDRNLFDKYQQKHLYVIIKIMRHVSTSAERCMGRPWVTHLKMGNPWVPIGYIANISSQRKYSVTRCISAESFIISTFIPINLNSIVTLETSLEVLKVF
jgi:hypothetical protein